MRVIRSVVCFWARRQASGFALLEHERRGEPASCGLLCEGDDVMPAWAGKGKCIIRRNNIASDNGALSLGCRHHPSYSDR